MIGIKCIFKSKVFEAELEQPARVKAKVEIVQNKIVDVKLHSLKGEQPIEPSLEEEFKGQIINAQSVNINGISSASILTKAVKTAVVEALAEARED